jgi:hypothetical protein
MHLCLQILLIFVTFFNVLLGLHTNAALIIRSFSGASELKGDYR